MPLLMLVALSGCAGRGTLDLLEARLREQEDAISRLKSKLAAATTELTAARKQTHALRDQLAGRGEKTLLPEQADVLFRATGIRFHKLLTGGDDGDGIPGDELLSALVIPHDADGELVKLPGAIQLDVSDPTKPPGQQRMGAWEFSVEESRAFWRRGFVGSGYLFRLPWKQVPETSELVLHARMTTPDGRQFDATQIIHVTPPPADADQIADVPPDKTEQTNDTSTAPELLDSTE